MENKERLSGSNLIEKKEGLAKFYIYDTDINSIPSKSMNVFYNEKMVINRDISSLAIMAYSRLYDQELVILDSMAASGISAIRLLLECENIKKIYINDINPVAVDLINKNLALNNLGGTDKTQIEVSRKDANFLFNEFAQKQHINPRSESERPNVISIDPFGTPNLYINSAFNAIQRKNGLMCITATDTAVLFGIRPKACVRKYMAKPLHSEYCKEVGARIIIYFMARMANVNKIGILPLLTFNSNHFIRVFAITYKNQEQISEDFKNYGYILHCKQCNYRVISEENVLHLPHECPICENDSKMDYAGPLWIGKLHDGDFLNELLHLNEKMKYSNEKRIHKIINYALDELNMPHSYYNLHKISQELNLSMVPKMKDILLKIIEKGFKASRTHFDFTSIKTDMTLETLKQILLENYK